MIEQRKLFALPRLLLLFGEVFMVLLWAIIAFWGVIFILKGFIDFTKLFFIDRVYGLAFLLMGVYFLKHVISHVRRVRSEGLRDLVQNFLDRRFVEIMATTIFLLMTAVLVTTDTHFLGTTLLLLPIIAGTTLGVGLKYFLVHTFGITFAPLIIVSSTWILELFWMYLFAKLVVWVITLFRLRSDID